MTKKQRNFAQYEDMLFLSHPVSKVHAPMAMKERAAQFAPFAALTGHNAAIAETARRTQSPMEIVEEQKQELNRKLQVLKERPDSIVSVYYFKEDEKKAGGMYCLAEGSVRKINIQEKRIYMDGGQEIEMENIVDIQGAVFTEYESDL